MGYQQIILLGNLTRELEVRQAGQSTVAKVGIAVSEKFRKQDGTVGENTEFFELELWDKGNLHQYLTKGTMVFVIGQQKTEKWQDQQGQNRETKKIRVSTIQLCGSRPQAAPQQQAYPPQGQAYPPQGAAPAYPPQGGQPAYPPQGGYQQPPQGGYPQPPQGYPQPPMPPQPGQPGNAAYPPMNSPAYTTPQDDDLPAGF